MSDVGRILIFAGATILLVGMLLWGLGRLGFRGLPGDVRIETESVRIHVPIVTCIALSLVLTALFWLWRWMRK